MEENPDLGAVINFIKNKKDPEADAAKQMLQFTVLPDHLQHNPFIGVPEEPTKEIELQVVTDSLNPNLGKVIVSEDGETATVYIPEGTAIKAVDHKGIRNTVNAGKFEFKASGVIQYSFIVGEQRTCVYYTGGEAEMNLSGAEESSEYGFDKPHPWPVCSNPAIIKMAQRPNPPCGAEQGHAFCSYYKPEPDQLVRVISLTLEDSDPMIVQIHSTRRGQGVRKYTVSNGPAGAASTVAFTVDSFEFKENLDKTLEEKLAELIASFAPLGMEDIAVEEVAKEKNRYFDYVLEG